MSTRAGVGDDAPTFGRQWINLAIMVAVLAFLLSINQGMAQVLSPDVRVIKAVPAGQVNWTEGLVMSHGRATRPPRQQQAMRNAHAAAVQAARQHLLTALGQVRLDASRPLDKALQEQPDLQQAVQALVAEADVYETRYVAGGTVESGVQVALGGRLMRWLLPVDAGAVAIPEPEPEAVYTGVVIDARGLAIQPALLPLIVDENGARIYAPEMVDAEIAAQRGYAAYARAFDEEPVVGRIGRHPLVLRARRTVGEARVNLVLRNADAAQIHNYAATRLLLQRCQLLIVM